MFLIILVGGKIGEKNGQKKSSRELKLVFDIRFVNGSLFIGKDVDDDDDDDGIVLKGNMLNNYDVFNFVFMEVGNEEDDFKFEEEVLMFLRFIEKFYWLLEN